MTGISKQRLKEMSDRLSSRITSKVIFSKNSEQRLFQDAVIRAYTTWAPQNWESVDSLFNEHFLTHRAAPFLIAYVKDGVELNPVELANVWAEQLTWFDEEMKQRHITKIVPAATDFLLCFEAEFQSHFHYLGNTGKGMSKVTIQTA
jgi:hypothetical protein